jgi:acyl-CoA thioester hydrolase
MNGSFPHSTQVRVRYADTDAMGVVYYANYLAYFEAGRVEYLRAANADYREIEADGAVAAVTRADCRYLAPARFDDLLAIHTRAAAIGRASLRFEYQIRREPDGLLLAEGYTEHACLNRQTLRPTRLPAHIRTAIERFQDAEDSAG